jgi:hypothetical protein
MLTFMNAPQANDKLLCPATNEADLLLVLYSSQS